MISKTHETMICKVCGSSHVVRVGKIRDIQRWWCKDCNKRFMDNGARFGMKSSALQVSLAVRCYYQGMSLNSIQEELSHLFNIHPSDSTIYYWVNHSTDMAIERLQHDHPIVGDTWIADETIFQHLKRTVCIWDILDQDTWFLLATQIVFERSTENARVLMKKAIEKAGKIPKEIRTSKLVVYFHNVVLSSIGGIAYPNKRTQLIEAKSSNELESYHNVLDWRANHMGRLKSIDSIVKYNDGWQVYYNYFSPNRFLAGKTPATMARTGYPRINYNGMNISSI